MAKPAKGAQAPPRVQLSYQLLRNTTSPDETSIGVKSFVANLPATEILKLGTKENLRNYIAQHNPRKRNRVHDAIRDTIQSEPQRFIVRNSGFVIAASEIEVDDNKKTIQLADASILNGAQSQGEIEWWIRQTYGEDLKDAVEDPPFFVRAEIIVDPDPVQVVETAIARNTATPVRSISQAGARGHLDDLEKSIQARRPDIQIRKKETDDNCFDTRKILQYARLLMPSRVSENDSSSEKLRPYKNPEQCLTDFSAWYERRESDPSAAAKYHFTVQIAPFAIEEYEYWERHEAWNGHHIWEETKKGGRACRRDGRSNKIVWVSPGLVFPLVGAMSEFVQESLDGSWEIKKPSHFRPDQSIAQAVAQFRSVGGDPMQMGRNAGAYYALRIYPAAIMAIMRDMNVATT